jgi:hypothetical protein
MKLLTKILFTQLFILFIYTMHLPSHTMEDVPPDTSNGKHSSTFSVVEIESEDFDNGKQFKNCPNVRYAVNFGGESFTSEKLANLKIMAPYICSLSLFEANLDNNVLNLLPVFPLVTNLDISNNYFDDNGLIYLPLKFPNLLALTISNNKISPKAGSALLQLAKLRYLDAGGTFLGSKGVATISQSMNLEYLNLRACGLDNEVFPFLSSMRTLKTLVLSNNNFNPHEKEKFLGEKKSDLEVTF